MKFQTRFREETSNDFGKEDSLNKAIQSNDKKVSLRNFSSLKSPKTLKSSFCFMITKFDFCDSPPAQILEAHG